jgi:signal transduction histidine kinase
MTRHSIRELLFPQDEREPDFRRELEGFSLTGLRVASIVGIGGPLLMGLIGFAGVSGILTVVPPGRMLAAVFLASVPLAISCIPAARPHLRLVGIVAGILISLEAIFGTMRTVPDPLQGALLGNAKTTVVLLVAVTAFPLKPLHALTMGLAVTAGLAAALSVAGDPGRGAIPLATLSIVALVSTLLTAVLYRQRAAAYWARRTAEESLEELKRAQARLVVSENALSLGRLAAALSHEMNSPLGALGSAVDTLASLAKLPTRPLAPERFADIVAGISQTVRQSFERLRETVDRMKHFSNLDRAETRVVDLNELWESTLALLGSELAGKAELKLDLRPLPPVKCRPQQLTAVFTNLLRNAAASIETAGTIEIASDRRGANVVLEVRDDGKGIPADRLKHLFDPSFRVQSGRVGTSWGLFVSRSIISEHGGQLEISSAVGKGTTAKIVLPLLHAGAA